MLAPMTRIGTGLAWIGVLALVGCDGSGPGPDAATAPLDAPGLDAPGLDAPGLDAPAPPDAALDAPGLDAPLGEDAPGATCARPPAAFDEGLTPTRTLYVAPGGTGDGSAAAPFGDLEAAARAATPGTRIVVRAGRYDAAWFLSDLAGTPTAPIWISGEPGAVLDAGGAGEVLHVSEASYLVIEGLEMTGSTVNGLNIDDGGSYDTPTHHVVLRDLFVHDIGTGGNNDCIKLSGIDDYVVEGSRIGACRAGDAIDHVGCHRGLIHDNVFEATAGGGIQMKGGSSDIVVHGNRFTEIAGRGINAGGSTGLEFFRPIDAPFEAARLSIVANVFERVGMNSGAPIAFVGCDACRFVHNTVIAPRTWVARILQETVDARFVPCRNGVFANNVIVFSRADLRTFVNVGSNTAPETFRFASNLWYATDDPSFAGPAVSGGIPAETGGLYGMDPRLAADLRPCDDGPAAGAADPAFDPIHDDLGGQCWRATQAIGAQEAARCMD
jgi:hypothetical protein